MKFRDILRDRSFWSLLIINLAIIFYYLYYNTTFKTLIWIYWCQSVMIGIATFLDLLTVKNVKPGSIELNNEPIKNDGKGTGCVALFFAVHFGLFHFVYFIFLFTITDAKETFDLRLFEVSTGAFALDQVWNFIARKNWERTHQSNVGAMFFMPYARIVPMHLTILIPAFIGAISRFGIFLLLKLVADLLMYIITLKIYGKPEYEDPTVLHMGK